MYEILKESIKHYLKIKLKCDFKKQNTSVVLR